MLKFEVLKMKNSKIILSVILFVGIVFLFPLSIVRADTTYSYSDSVKFDDGSYAMSYSSTIYSKYSQNKIQWKINLYEFYRSPHEVYISLLELVDSQFNHMDNWLFSYISVTYKAHWADCLLSVNYKSGSQSIYGCSFVSVDPTWYYYTLTLNVPLSNVNSLYLTFRHLANTPPGTPYNDYAIITTTYIPDSSVNPPVYFGTDGQAVMHTFFQQSPAYPSMSLVSPRSNIFWGSTGGSGGGGWH
jgi:hypothetical protein